MGRVDVVAQPHSGVGDPYPRRRERLDERAERLALIPIDRGFKPQRRRIAPLKPASQQRVIVVAGHDDHAPRRPRPARAAPARRRPARPASVRAGARPCRRAARAGRTLPRRATSAARSRSRRSTSTRPLAPRCRSEMTSVRRGVVEWSAAPDGGALVEWSAAPGGAGRHGLADHLREHEADVLLHHFELLHIGGSAGPEELDQPLDERFGRARPGRDADDALAGEPLLADLGLVVDQVRSRRRARARPRRAGSSSTSCASRSRARGRTARPVA